MAPSEIALLAQKISEGLIWPQWQIYLIGAGLFVVVVVVNERLKAFANKSGEIDALVSKFDVLTDQLKANTETVETVKRDINHADWAVREWKTIRRLKLEELMRNISNYMEWQSAYCSEYVWGREKPAGESPMAQIDLLATLYFTELTNELHTFNVASHNYTQFVLVTGRSLIEPRSRAQICALNKDAIGQQSANDEVLVIVKQFSEAHKPLYADQSAAKSALILAIQKCFRGIFPDPIG